MTTSDYLKTRMDYVIDGLLLAGVQAFNVAELDAWLHLAGTVIVVVGAGIKLAFDLRARRKGEGK